MPRAFNGNRLVIASHNKGKVREIGELLEPFGVEVVSAGELGLPEPEETGSTFVANAELKALAAAQAADLPALADDSGLEVAALDGDPGIYSARWAGPTKDFAVAMEKVENALQEKGASSKADRRANFTCSLCLAWPDGHVDCFEGKVFGHLVWPMRGDRGFGYDPVFVADGMEKTFAEIDPAEKHAMSHRAEAFAQLVEACFRS
ncbi:MAG: RdgB/HAM1 family non-canonical purine NTP pyrophosphatase [Magnetovibrionaceae bacterium]